MKVLFLDVDGVLNSAEWFATNVDWRSLNPKAVALVLAVLDATGAQLVLSSTWRLVDDCVECLKGVGLPIADMTPRIDTNNRGREIRAWLDAHPDIDTFAILDDDEDAGDCGLRKHFVRTSWQKGLQPEHAARAIRLLGAAQQAKVA